MAGMGEHVFLLVCLCAGVLQFIAYVGLNIKFYWLCFKLGTIIVIIMV